MEHHNLPLTLPEILSKKFAYMKSRIYINSGKELLLSCSNNKVLNTRIPAIRYNSGFMERLKP